MPRIPVRIEPYTSPSRQHRHFKNKRDQVLRALGKAAYINGSHFAIMWVSARGDVETYASEALQDRLEDWFVKSGISDEAKGLVIGAQGNPRANPFKGDDEQGEDGVEEDEDLSEDERGLSLQVPGANSASRCSSSLNTPVMPNDDVFTDANQSFSIQQHQSRLDARPKLQRSASTSAGNARGRKAIVPLDTNVANEQYYKARHGNELHPQSAIEGHYMNALNGLGLETSEDMESIIPPHSAPLRMAAPRTSNARSSTSTQQHVPQFETRLDNLAARTAFLELRFSQLQQGMCKTVAKAWIKIIEPKKQTRCPYNKGEEGKPGWWPEGVRHKEPDHLMKPERHALLLTILRSPKIQVARLQLATAEVVALIKADKVSLLMDVYRIAREEEKMREANVDLDTPMKVGISTLDGWSEADQSVTADRAGSPMDDETETSGKKRSVGMGRSSSASSAMKSNKRRASAMDLSSSPLTFKGDTLDVPDASRRASANWMMQEATQNSMKKAMTSSSMAAAAAAAAGYGNTPTQQQQQQAALEQNYGLITPLTGNSQLMDPSFLQATKESNETTQFVAGYMSAPQPPHAQLFPHANFQFQASNGSHQQQQQQHQYNLHTTRDASNLFAYQQRMDTSGGESGSTNNGALGLQGMGMHWSNAGFGQDFSTDSNGANGWWQQQQQQQPQPQKDTPNPNGDNSFDASFASTIDSAGPATPPLSAGAIQRSSASKQGNAGPAGVGTHDYVQHLQFQQQQQQQNQTQEHHHQSSQGQQINRNPYNLSLGKVPTTYDSWSYQAQAQ